MNANTKVLSAFPRVSNALTFARRFKVDLPPGALFYPQCGNDSGEVLLQFMDSVSEFHFVNRDEIPVLPALSCRGDREIIRPGAGTVSQYVFPSEIVTSARTLPRSHHSFWYQAHIYQGGAYNEQAHISYASTNEIWTVASNLQNRVRVHGHRFDELESLKALDSISVFFCPGPAPERIDNNHSLSSQGTPGPGDPQPVLRSLKVVVNEEGYTPPLSNPINDYNPAGNREERRSLWFTPKNSVKVLDKLTNGGIIIAGACPEARCDLLWRRLGRQTSRLRDGSDRNRRPENFTYANRRFRCLGECGHRFGPVFAWQVYRLS